MTTHLTDVSAENDEQILAELDQLLDTLALATVHVSTQRTVLGEGAYDPGVRDVCADVRIRVAAERLTNPLAKLAVAITPVEDDHVEVLLAHVTGVSLDPFTLLTDPFDVLADLGAEQFEPMFTIGYDIVATGELRLRQELAESVGTFVLLHELNITDALDTLSAPLVQAFVSQALRDVAVGACAVLAARAGEMSGRPEHDALASFWTGLGFTEAGHGIWVADVGMRAFAAPARTLVDLLS